MSNEIPAHLHEQINRMAQEHGSLVVSLEVMAAKSVANEREVKRLQGVVTTTDDQVEQLQAANDALRSQIQQMADGHEQYKRNREPAETAAIHAGEVIADRDPTFRGPDVQAAMRGMEPDTDENPCPGSNLVNPSAPRAVSGSLHGG